MLGCLQKYVGKYCVRAEYDESTNDLPRLEDGSLDPSFEDLYIDCRNNIKIKYSRDNILSCYVPTRQKGINVLKKIYTNKISKKLPKERTIVPTREKDYFENLCAELVNKKILVNAEVLDYEVYFEFQDTMIDYIAKLVGAKKEGAKNGPYQIPEKDLALYKAAIKDFPKQTVAIKGVSRTMTDGLLIKKVTSQFDEVIVQSQTNGFDIIQDKKDKGLKGKEYIHSLGKNMWLQYCHYLKDFAEKCK